MWSDDAVLPMVRTKQGSHLGFYTEFAARAGGQVILKTGISFVSMDGAEKNLHAEVADWDFDRVREHAAALWDQALGKIRVTGGTVESNPYQQGWFVPQDIPGMVKLMGGREAVIKDLQHFFQQTPENMLWNNYYNHANEPVHHVPSFSIGWERPG